MTQEEKEQAASADSTEDYQKAANLKTKECQLIEDIDNQWFENIIATTDQYFRDNYPVVFLINADGIITFKSEGYNIGTGNLILQSTK